MVITFDLLLNYFEKLLLSLLLLSLAVMTYNQVQSFQISDFANHYKDIEITGYKVLYSESIAGRGVTALISWSGPDDCFNRVFEEYIGLFQFLLVGYRPPLVMLLKQGTQLIFTCMIMLVAFLLQLIIHFHS